MAAETQPTDDEKALRKAKVRKMQKKLTIALLIAMFGLIAVFTFL